jgi:hypothetical protein
MERFSKWVSLDLQKLSLNKNRAPFFFSQKKSGKKEKGRPGKILKQTFDLFAKIPINAKKIVSRKFFNAHKSQFVV